MILQACVMLALFGGFSKQDWTVIERDAAPKVAYAIDEDRLELRAENPGGKDGTVTGRLVVARGKRMKRYDIKKFPFTAKYGRDLPGAGDLRLALEVSRFDGDKELIDRRIHFSNPEMNGLPASPENMAVFDLEKHLRTIEDRKHKLCVKVEREQLKVESDGVYTLVIEDMKGNRIRNLVSAQPIPKDQHSFEVEWDGCDELGKPVAPGTYRYRGLAHPGITHEYLMRFYTGEEKRKAPRAPGAKPDFKDFKWGPNHSMMTAMTANPTNVYFAGRVTEGSPNIIEVDPDGHVVRTYHQSHYRGCSYIDLAIDDDYLYTVMQGHSFDGQRDVRERVGVVRYRLGSAHRDPKVGPSSKNTDAYIYESPELAKDAKVNICDNGTYERIISGSIVYGGELLVCNLKTDSIMVVDPATCLKVRDIPLKSPRAPFVMDGRLHVASGRDILSLDPKTGAAKKLFSLPFEPVSISHRKGELAVVGAGDSTVKIYQVLRVESGALSAKEVATIGEPGGAYEGKWRAKRLVNPTAVQFACNGTLWTTERRDNPKRVVNWSRDGEIIYEKYGVPWYGSPTLGFDPTDASRVIANGTVWKVDYAAQTASPVAVLSATDNFAGVLTEGYNKHVTEYKGKRYIIDMGRALKIAEWRADGSWKPVMCISDVLSFWSELDGGHYAPFEDFAQSEWNIEDRKETYYQKEFWGASRRGFVWLDRNGNGRMDREEFTFMPRGRILDGYFGLAATGLGITFIHKDKMLGERAIRFEPDGFLENGVPNYDLEKAFAQAKPLEDLPAGLPSLTGAEGYNDLRGNVIVNKKPFLTSVSKDGKINWIYKNRWPGVHGSHGAPLYKRGQLVGLLHSMGAAPLDKESDVIAIMTNTGLVYLMTSDGLFLDEAFHDGRQYSRWDESNFGGESFGGAFEYDRVNKRYYLQGGHGGFRLYELKGFDKVRRFGGTFDVSEKQLAAASRRNAASGVSDRKDARAKLVMCDRAGLATAATVGSWSHFEMKNSFAMAVDKDKFFLRWNIQDPTPWKNNGKLWTHLYKTGDSVDFRFSVSRVVDEKDEKRTNVREGDFRLLIAPFEGSHAAVLYRYKAGKTSNAGQSLNPVDFASPWRTYTVPDVRRIDVGFHLKRGENGYEIYATVPFKELGIAAEDLKGSHKCDFGVIYGDNRGEINTARSYWSNKATGLVNDVPGEMMPDIVNWGVLEINADGAPSSAPAAKQSVVRKKGIDVTFKGFIGNSGTKDDPVRFHPMIERYGGGGVQLQPYYDPAKKRFYMSSGAEEINVYSIDGRLVATYKMPTGMFSWHTSNPLVRYGNDLYFVRNGKLMTFPLNAPDGTVVAEAPCKPEGKIRMISGRFFKDELALYMEDKSLHYWNIKTGAIRKIGEPGEAKFTAWNNYQSGLEWTEDGDLLFFTDKWVNKIVDGKFVQNEEFPKLLITFLDPTAQLQLTGGAFYAGGISAGSMIRINKETLTLDPGAIAAEPDNDIGGVGGVVHVEGNTFAIGTAKGGIVILRWDERNKRMYRVRRIGATPETRSLVVFPNGRILAGNMMFDWDSAENAVVTRSLERVANPFIADRVIVGKDAALGKTFVGLTYSGEANPALFADTSVTSGAGIQCRGIEGADDVNGKKTLFSFRKSVVGIASSQAGTRLYVLKKNGAVTRYDMSYSYAKLTNPVPVTLALKHTCTNFSGMARMDDETFLLAAETRLLVVKPTGDTLVETAVLATNFEPGFRVAADAEHIVVTERGKNRATILSLGGKVLKTLDVPNPGSSSICGKYLVIQDTAAQRVLKFEAGTKTGKKQRKVKQ